MVLRRYPHHTDTDLGSFHPRVRVHGLDSPHLRREKRCSPSVFSHLARLPHFAEGSTLRA
jgi:hypothetical protein